MKRIALIAGVVLPVLIIIYIGRQLTRNASLPDVRSTPAFSSAPTSNRSAAKADERKAPGGPRGRLVAAEDAEFAERVLPFVKRFFRTLERAGVSPIKEELIFKNIRIHRSEHAMDCRFLIGETWTVTFVESAKYTGIVHFGQRGPDNAFRAISHANTNALIRLSEDAIKMPESEAKRIIEQITDAFGVDRSRLEKPEIYPEKMFHYDLGMYTAAYRKKGSDPLNGLNYMLDFSIKATSPTGAVLVMYSESPLRP